jgi:hypothetical protein
MSKYIQENGKQQWLPRRGQKSGMEANRRNKLVRDGKACHWAPLRNIEDAIMKAGL